MKERPVKIHKDSDLTPDNVEKTNQHYDQIMREIESRLSSLESTAENHENRIAALE
jgi:hypothetical protein